MALAKLSSTWRRPISHGGCWEGSGTETKKAASWEGYRTRTPQQKVAINYDKLREVCLHSEPANSGRTRSKSATGEHDRFMAEYTSIFAPKERPSLSRNSARKHSCNDTDSKFHSFDISMALIDIHGRDKKQQEIVDLNSRLKAMLSIARKQPVQRSSAEVKELAQHFLHFPGLLPRMEMEVLIGVASRAKMELIPKHAIGHSLPGRGGVYIILQGCVEKLCIDPNTEQVVSEMLEAGEFFGELTPSERHASGKNPYPSYATNGLCTLIRLTSFNYEKVLRNWESASFNEKYRLIKACPLLQSVSPSVLTKLAEAITWETIEANQIVLSEGEEIARVGFIQTGSCVAHVKVPRAPRQTQVTVGQLKTGDCIGEVMLRGNDRQPYTIVSMTKLRVGWVTSTTLGVNEVEKHILSDKEFTLKPLSPDDIRHKYASMLMAKQWDKMREDIVQGVVVERGIRRGQSKWKHSRSHSDLQIAPEQTIA